MPCISVAAFSGSDLQDKSYCTLVSTWCDGVVDYLQTKRLGSCRTLAWRQQILERVCRPALGSLGQRAEIAGDQHVDDGPQAAAKHQSAPKGRSGQLHATGRHHRRFANDDPLQSLAWDKHCTASMLAGMLSHQLRNLLAFLPSHNCSDYARRLCFRNSAD